MDDAILHFQYRQKQNYDRTAHLWFYFKGLEHLFVVNSGVLCCVIKGDFFSITTQPAAKRMEKKILFSNFPNITLSVICELKQQSHVLTGSLYIELLEFNNTENE